MLTFVSALSGIAPEVPAPLAARDRIFRNFAPAHHLSAAACVSLAIGQAPLAINWCT